jgi:hypothetical protein
MIGAVELSSREGLLEPAEEGLVVRVHPQGDLRLLPVASKMALANEQADEDADI